MNIVHFPFRERKGEDATTKVSLVKYSLYFPTLISERGKEGYNVTPLIYIVAGGKAGPAFGPLAEKSEGVFGNILLLDFYFNLPIFHLAKSENIGEHRSGL